MKVKFLVLFLTVFFIFINVQASKFKFVFAPGNIEQNVVGGNVIYCDTEGHWCRKSAERLYKENIFSGIKIGDKKYFEPERQITRGEFLLYVSAVLKTNTGKKINLPFDDVSSVPYWELPAVQCMYEMGVIKGNSDDGKLTFNHDEYVTRVEAAQIINNIIGQRAYSDEEHFSDSYLIPRYFADAVNNVSGCGIMQGYGDKSFRPYVNITRSMLADILCRLNDFCESDKDVLNRLQNMQKKSA
ncbi:MAG: S-layer homology domain-containing protein [Clostridia bacterium]|nr:S-layer homology domain-containing protein [Clostridia bacterium]